MNLLNSFLVSIFLSYSPKSGNEQLIQLREGFRQAIVNDQVANFIEQVEQTTLNQPELLAYAACAYALKAKSSWNPLNKLASIRKYDQMMTEAARISPSNIEIRFLRFSIEINLPDWLGFSNHLTEDQLYISSHLEEIEGLMLHREYARYILYFLRETDRYEEKTIIKLREALIKE